MKIAHFADVHFRGLARHSEYRESFEDAFKTLREIKPDLIYIGGDIVHSKTQGITPELIDILRWWFKSLAEIAPVDVLLGNHDGLIMNKQRLDAISPIIATLDNPRIRLMKASGIYSTVDPDVNFCVFSLFDLDGWKNVFPTPGKINIALYHGSVRGAKSDTDYELDGETTLSQFENYDFSLLGDIHKRQFLNKQRTIAYCGSTIQQNYAEEANKGFLLWDIKSRDDFDVSYHPVKNVHPFVTVEWNESVDTAAIIKNIPEKSRIRLDVHSRDTSRLKDFCSLIESTISPIEITYKTHADSIKQLENKEDLVAAVDVKQSLIDFIARRSLPTAVVDDAMKKLDYYLSSREGAEDVARNIKWDLNRIEFDNLFAYGEKNYIDFNSMPGITGIFGKNRSGKSSIIGSIVYSLFNTTDRGSMKNLHIINSKKDSCNARSYISVSSNDYEIHRETIKNFPKKGDVWASTALSVTKTSSGEDESVDLNDEQRRETEKILRKLIGTADDFFYTCLAPQGNMNLFINEKSTARKQMLTRFLDIDYFEELHNRVKADIAPYKTKIKIAGSVQECKSSIELCQKKIEENEVLKLASLESAERFRNLISDLSRNIPQDVVKSRREIAKMNSDKAILMVEIEKINNEIISENTHQVSITEKLKKTNDILDIVNFEELESQASDQRDIARQIDSDERDLKSKKRERDILAKSVELLDKVPCMGQYPACQFICESHRNKEQLPAIDLQLSIKDRAVSILRNRSAALEKDNPAAAFQKAVKIRDLQKDLKIELGKHESKLGILNERLKSKNTESLQLDTRIAEISEKLAGTDIPDEIKTEEYSDALRNAEKQSIDCATIIGIQTEKISQLRGQIEDITLSQDMLRSLETLEAAFSKNGVSQDVISFALPKINAEISEILDGIAGFTVEIECNDTNTVEIYLNYGDNRRLIELGSGMEKMISSIAIRVALTNISSLPKSSMLIIDEGFGTLDDNNLEACARLLTNLKSYFKNILVISHVDTIKDIVDNVIDIGWEDGFAKVTCD
jgi:DNA repair exonuclease SbcCD ATPase subunit/DNA repair exonuclease SbcCD nuclease subunit